MAIATDYESSIKETESPEEDELTAEREAINTCSTWFDADREAKEFYMDEMNEMYKLYKSKHWDIKGEDGRQLRTEAQKHSRPNAVENISFSLVEGLVAEFSQDIDVVDYPVERGDDETAQVMTDLKEFIAYKNRVRTEKEKWLRFFFLYGTAIWHTYWDPSWSGGRGPNRWRGEIRWNALHPQVVYPDARVREDIEEGRRIHKAQWRTIEYVEEEFPENADYIQPDALRHDMFVGDEMITEASESGEQQVLIVETWYKGEPLILDPDEENEGPGMHVIWWAGEGNNIYLKHANYIYFDQEEDDRFPFVFSQCYPRENSIWGYGEMYYLKNSQIMRNKTAEIIIEGHVHHALGQTVYNETAVTPKQQKLLKEKGTLPGFWFPVKNIEGIRRMQGQNVPGSLLREMERLQKVSETLVGRFDISQGRTPGSVTAFRALDLLSSRAQIRLRSKEKAMTMAYEDVGNYINHLIVKFYTDRRAYRVLGDDAADTVYEIFDPIRFKKVFIFDLGDSLPLSDFQSGGWETALDMIEGEDYEIYCPEFDTQCRVTSSLPTDRVFYMDMAKELFMGQLIDMETFWYVLDNGKFPPYKELIEQIQENAEQMQQAQQAQQGGQPGAQPGAQRQMPQPEQMAELERLFDERPDLADEFNNMSEEEQMAAIQDLLGG